MLLPVHKEFINIVLSELKSKLKLNRKEKKDLIQGLFFLDLSCPTYKIIENKIQMNPVLCKQFRLLTLGKKKNLISSQLEESHGGLSVHSMSMDESLTNNEMKKLFLRKCIILYYITLTNKERPYVWLGMILHMVQDTWAPSHIYRNGLMSKNKESNESSVSEIFSLLKDEPNVMKKLKTNNEDNSEKDTMDLQTIIKKNIYKILANKKNRSNLFNSLTDKSITLYMNTLIFLILNSLNTEKKLELVNLLNKMEKKTLLKSLDSKKPIPNDIFKSKLTYYKFTKFFRRIYKLSLHILFFYDNENKIFENIIVNKFGRNMKDVLYRFPERYCSPIVSFLYFKNQNSKNHAKLDCLSTLKKNFKDNYNCCITDTINILYMYNQYKTTKNMDISEALVTMYEYLDNYVLQLDPYCKNKSFSDIFNKDTKNPKLKKIQTDVERILNTKISWLDEKRCMLGVMKGFVKSNLGF